MHLDVQDLRNFYYRTALGRSVKCTIGAQVLRMWPEAKGQTVVGFGFAVPFLRPYLQQARRVTALMPGPQGVMPWPNNSSNVSVLCQETLWPLETGHVDRLLVVHGLETSEQGSALLSECWRVLGPGGKAVFVVPNRTGLWSRSDQTPLGFGRPYSSSQLETQLRLHAFMPERHAAMLYRPPSERRFWMKTAPIWERAGRSVSAVLAAGVLMVEVSKRIQPNNGVGVQKAITVPLTVLRPLPKTTPV
ncbi:MAG: methyltransferase domain-containing protein [Paracoccaceae bacterium]|nr:methyltransferase domain-containing protein [Paracoccaceae bacterium]